MYTEENNAIPLWRDPIGAKHYDVPDVLAAPTLAANLLIARLSVAGTIHHMAHGGVSSAGHVDTFPNPVELIAASLSRPPSEVTIARVRRGATARAAAKQNRLYTVRASKVIYALRWPKARNPYYTDVAIDQSRLSGIPEGAEIPGVQDLEPGGRPLPEDKGPSPDQTMPGGDAAEAAYEKGGMPIPEVAPDFREEVRELLETAHVQGDKGKTHAGRPSPKIIADPTSEFKTRGFPRATAPLLFPGGPGCFFDDGPYGGIRLREADRAPSFLQRRKG